MNLQELNPKQYEAVTTTKPKVLVMAGAAQVKPKS